MAGSVDQKDLEEAYEEVVYWCKNDVMVPTGASVKKFIDEIRRLFDQWSNETSEKYCA